MSVLVEYAIAACFAYCRVVRIFQQNAHIAYFTRINWHFRRQFKYSLCFCYPFLLGFVTSTIWLPTEWHHPCVRTPVERDGVAMVSSNSVPYFHIFAAYLVFMRSAYSFRKCRIKPTCLLSTCLHEVDKVNAIR